MLQDVEQSFLGHVGRWSGGPLVGRRVEAAAFELAGDNSHFDGGFGIADLRICGIPNP
jgi:hypothetical protein